MPPRNGQAVTWRWCRKNRVWSIRDCKHSRCITAPMKVQEQKPTEAPATA